MSAICLELDGFFASTSSIFTYKLIKFNTLYYKLSKPWLLGYNQLVRCIIEIHIDMSDSAYLRFYKNKQNCVTYKLLCEIYFLFTFL